MEDIRSSVSRRGFLKGAAGAAAAAGMVGAMPGWMGEALADPQRRGRMDDIEHVVILMQENRSFDHYYGTIRGVRGFGDRAALRLSNGKDVFHQPDGQRPDGGYLLPFHVDTSKVDGQDLADLDHSWDGTHGAWNEGADDNWVATKTELTMSYFTAADLPFHRALGRAFTVCDNYFCSVQGPTTPNRLYLWTGTIDPQGRAGGPVITNPDDYLPVYHWTTYPERLQSAGISWQLYANDEIGDDPGSHPFVGDYGDNPLWFFQPYHDALASPDPAIRQLAERGNVHGDWKPDSGQGKVVNHVLADFISDCAGSALPAVSWIVAPYGYSEHPLGRPVDGAAYIQGVLEALWSNQRLWNSTAVFIDFDENDGFFDHLVPPVAPPGTPDEFVGGRPIGLGPRVPMTVISPWSRGGWVNSQVFDHTSVLRFLEAWTGVAEPNISAWRRSICGDLTSCFDFRDRDRSIPRLPDTAALRRQADQRDPSLPPVTPPASGTQVMAVQEAGSVGARPLPYQPVADIVSGRSGQLVVNMANRGTSALQLSVYAYHLTAPAQRVDVGPRGQLSRAVGLGPLGEFDVAVYGPNGFLREARSDGGAASVVDASLALAGSTSHPTLELVITNGGSRVVDVRVANDRGGASRHIRVGGRSHQTMTVDPLAHDHGWYDLSLGIAAVPAFARRFAGHLENGQSTITG